MSLIELRRSIASIITVYKTTSAMRILAISLHAHVKASCEMQDLFMHRFNEMIEKHLKLQDSNEYKNTTELTEKKTLFIFVGSQKGLCGSLNQEIASTARRIIKHASKDSHITCMILGKQLFHLLPEAPAASLWIPGITKDNNDALINTIKSHAKNHSCTHITFVYMHAKNLFHRTIITSSQRIIENFSTKNMFYTGHFDVQKIIQSLVEMRLNNFLRSSLLQAFLAEQASRFTAMDAASSNAEESIARKRITYNKLRQAAITRELQDLVANWSSE